MNNKEAIVAALKERIENLLSLVEGYWELDKERYYYTQGKIAGYRQVIDLIEG